MKYWLISVLVVSTSIFVFPKTASNSKTPSSVESMQSMAVFDVSLEKTSISGGPIKYGVSVPFNIVVRNDGDMTIQNIDVIDYVPSGFTFDATNNLMWSLSTDVAGAYERRIPGPIDPGLTATITINLILEPSDDPVNWINQAEVFAFQDDMGNQVEDQDPDSTADKSPDDPESEDDHDTQTVRVYDLALTKMLTTPQPYFYFDTLTFITRIYNQGNETTGDVIITDYITEGYGYDAMANAALAGWAGPVTAPLKLITGLAPGDSIDVPIKLVLLPNMFDAGAWDNYAEIFQVRDAGNNVVNNNEADSEPNSNSIYEQMVTPGSPFDGEINGNGEFNGVGTAINEDEDDHDVATPRVLDIALKKERGTAVASFSYIQNVEFTIDIFNQGNVDINQYTIIDTIPCGLEFIEADNLDWTYDPIMNSVRYVDNTVLPASSDRQVSLQLAVNPCYLVDPQIAWDNFTEIESVVAADGLNNEDIDGSLDSNFGNDGGGTLADDNDIDGNGPRENEDEDNHDIERVDILDLALRSQIATPEPFSYNQDLTFNVTIYNQGNIITDSSEFITIFRDGYSFPPGPNAGNGWSMVDDSTLTILHNELLLPGDSIVLPLVLRVEEANERLDWVTRSYILFQRDTFGLNRSDDADSFPFGENDAEVAVVPGDPSDDNIFILGPQGSNLVEDDHDPAGFFVSDLSLQKTIDNPQSAYAYGSTITYNLTVTNDGGNDITRYELVDYIPCGLDFTPNNGWSMDMITGYLEYIDTDGLAAGQSEVIQLTLTVVECTMPTTEAWVNVAEISAMTDEDDNEADFDSNPDQNPLNDPVGEDDIDSVSILIDDLSLTKSITSDISNLNFGDPLTFTIEITNEGNVPQANILLTDYLPCGFALSGDPQNNGWELNNINGFYERMIPGTLAPGESIPVDLIAIFTQCTPTLGAYTNVAEITSSTDTSTNPLDDNDSNPNNNPNDDPPGEDDIDEAELDFFDLSLDKEITSSINNLKYGSAISFDITITNEGTIDAKNVDIVEYLRCGYAFSTTGNTGWELDNNTGFLTYTHAPTIPTGQSITIPLTLTIQSCDSQINPWLNVAEIEAADDPDDNPGNDVDSDPDDIPTNDPPGEDDIDETDLPVFDLALSKSITNGTTFQEGDPVNFNINIANQGNVIAGPTDIVEYLPCGLAFSTNGNAGWNLGVDGYLRYKILNTIVPQSSVDVPLTLTVQLCTNEPNDFVNKAEIEDDSDENGDPTGDFDSDPNDNPTDDPIGEDDIDEVEVNVPLPDGSIGDYIWEDIDGDGFQDGSEPGIADVIIKLHDFNGVLINSTLSDANGFYEFTEVPSGDYYVRFCVSNEYTPTTADDAADNVDSDVTGANGDNTTSTFTLAGGEELETIDAGYYRCAKISGTIWYDYVENDVHDAFENGINGLEVRLYQLVDGSFVLSSTAFTGHKPGTPSDDGYFYFCVAPGTYYVEVIMPPLGLVQVRPGIGNPANDSDFNNGITTTFTINSGGEKCDFKGGFYPMATMGNLIWFDDNQNGLQDSNEQPVQGVEVNLYDVNNQMVQSTLTETDGTYAFEYLEKEEYFIEVIPPSGYDFTTANAGPSNMDSDIDHSNGLNTSPKFMMAPGVNALHVDGGIANGILPVDWLWVSAESQEEYNLVEWQVATEINLSHYELLIYNSKNDTYSSIGKVLPNKDLQYAFNDLNVTQNGLYQYKVRQYDYDGRFSDSDIVTVDRSYDTDIKVYPNPATDFFNIEIGRKSNNTLTVNILNSTGVLVKSKEVAVGHSRVNLDGLPNGNYMVRVIENGNIVKNIPLIKIE